MKTAAALIRVSTDQQELNSQIESLKLEATKLGYIILDDLIFGEKVTGYDGGFIKDKKTGEIYRRVDRDSIIDLKQACEQDKKNRIQAIFIWELSRLSRKPSTLLDYVDFFTILKKPILFTSHNIWTIDPATLEPIENSKIFINMLATFGEQERNKLMQRYQRGKRYAANDNRYIGGSIPYGYDIENIKDKKYYILHTERSEIIKDIYDKYLYDGWASDRIARYLNAKEIPTYYNINNPDKKLKTNIGNIIERKNIRWSHTSVLQILRNSFYKGERSYQDLTVECPIIIMPEIWEQVQQRLKDNNKFGEKKRKFNYPVKEILRCGSCNSKFYGAVTSSKQQYYCNRFQLEGKKCNCNKLHKYKLDGLIWTFISNTSNVYNFFEELTLNNNNSNRIKELKDLNDLELAEIQKLQERKSSLLKMFRYGTYTEEELNENALELVKQINSYQEIIKEREAEISILNHQQNLEITPENLQQQIIKAGEDVLKIANIINSIIRTITVHTLVEKRFSLLEINLYWGVRNTHYIIYDHSDRTNIFYYVELKKHDYFDPTTHTFRIIPFATNDTILNIASKYMQTGELEKHPYNDYNVYRMLNEKLVSPFPYKNIEENPFTYANPKYAAYKKKNNARKNELKKERKKRISKDYIKTAEEEYKYQIANIHNKRSKIRNMSISNEEKEILLNKTRIELDAIRNHFNK